MLTCSGVRRDSSLVTVSPAAENTRSEGINVVVMHGYLRANLASLGNLIPFTLHQSVGVQSRGGGGSLRKF